MMRSTRVQGMPGAYSEAAALTAYPDCEPVPHEQFENAFQATEQWTADRAVGRCTSLNLARKRPTLLSINP